MKAAKISVVIKGTLFDRGKALMSTLVTTIDCYRFPHELLLLDKQDV